MTLLGSRRHPLVRAPDRRRRRRRGQVAAHPRVRDPGSASERSQVLRGRCLPYGDGVTFWPIAEIVRSAAGINDEDPRDVALAEDHRHRSGRRRPDRRSDRGRRSGRRRDRPVHDPVPRAGAVLGDPQAARGDREPPPAGRDRRRHPRRGADLPRAARPPARHGARRADPAARLGPARALRDASRVGRGPRRRAHRARAAVRRRGRLDRRPAARPASTGPSASGS